MCWHFSHFTSNLITGDVISQQFENFLHSDAKGLDFISFSPSEECRVDVFLHQRMDGSYPDLWTFCKNLLLLSHWQAEVERGFSTNKEVETCNLTEEGSIAHVTMSECVEEWPNCLWPKRWSATVLQHAPGTEHTWRRRGVKGKKMTKRKKEGTWWRNWRILKGNEDHWRECVRVFKMMADQMVEKSWKFCRHQDGSSHYKVKHPEKVSKGKERAVGSPYSWYWKQGFWTEMLNR